MKMLFGTGFNSEGYIDLRSDVVTKPTKEMLESMFSAKVGNDGWREDPTVIEFERKVAKLLGKDAAIIVPSGTMANEISLRLLCEQGSEAIVERNSHIFNYEVAGPAALSGIQLLPLEGNNGVLSWEQIKNNIRPNFHQFPRTSCISLENTHNNGGGVVYPLDAIKDISANARKLGISMHLDGARLLNACVKSGIKPEEYAKYFDLVSICLSKGLGCPGGSVIAGKKELIDRAVLVRRQLGGSMRQISGYMAAAGLFALENNVDRLKEDHRRAKIIARAIKKSAHFTLLTEPETNIVLFIAKNKTPEQVCNYFKEEGILIAPYNYPVLRIVTHLDINDKMLKNIIEAIDNYGSKKHAKNIMRRKYE